MPERLIALVAVVSGLGLAAAMLLADRASALSTGLGLALALLAGGGLIVLLRAVIVLERRETGR